MDVRVRRPRVVSLPPRLAPGDVRAAAGPPCAGPRGFPPRHRRRRQPAAGHDRRLSAPVADLRTDDGGVLLRAGALRRCAPPRAPAPGAPGLAARPALARSGERRAQREAGHDMTTITPKFTQMASGLRFPEGPVAMPDGSVILVEIE